MALPDGNGFEGFLRQVVDWAAYLVATLTMLLYKHVRAQAAADKKQIQEKAEEDKNSYTLQLAAFKGALDKCITRDDFDRHEAREEKDREERRAAEQTLFAKIDKINDYLMSIVRDMRR